MAAKNAGPRAEDVALQLCEPRAAAFDRPGWLWELKLDGFRALASREGAAARLVFRRGRDAAAQFPEIAAAVRAVAGDDFLLDGELVIQDGEGRPIFHKLLERSALTSPAEQRRLAEASPAVYFAFDLLRLDGEDLRERPLVERKQLLERLLPSQGRVRWVDHVEERGRALEEAVRAKGLEGVVGKRADAPYRGGRGPDWVKVAFTSACDFAVVGYAQEFGALHLAVHDGQGLVYAGKVGAGFGPKQQRQVRAQLTGAARKTAPCRGPLTDDADVVWTEPGLVVEVRYKSWPAGLAPREPVLLRFRPDKTPQECAPPPSPVGPADSPVVALTNPRKVYFPGEGITKREIFDYYRAVSPWLLPWLKDRPLTMTRYPDGIAGKSFFQKAKPAKGAPGWLRTTPVHSEEEGRELQQVVCDDLRTLEWVAQLGALPLHVPAGRLPALQLADWCVIDFDPKDAPFESVIILANTLRRICEQARLPAFPKTSGASGLHVLLPLGAQVDHAFALKLAELLGAMIVGAHPQLATLERVVGKRAGRVYVDCLQNGTNKLIAAPFCVRARAGAPVSMPLTWAEVRPGLRPDQFTVRDAVARLRQGGDPMAPLLGLKPDLGGVLARLMG